MSGFFSSSLRSIIVGTIVVNLCRSTVCSEKYKLLGRQGFHISTVGGAWVDYGLTLNLDIVDLPGDLSA